MKRRRSLLLPVVILGGGAALACGPPAEHFDSATGCCMSYCNACGGSPFHECADTGEHGDATCNDPNEPTADTGDTGDSAR